MPEARPEDVAEFGKLLRLRQEQVDDVEAFIGEDLQRAQAAKSRCEQNLRTTLSDLAGRFPWVRRGGAQYIDRTKRGEMRRVRRAGLDAIDAEFARLERELLPANLRG